MDDREKFLKKNGSNKKIYLENSIKLIRNISRWKSYRISSIYETINNRTITIKKSNRCFNFKLDGFNLVKDMAKLQGVGYGLTEPFVLTSIQDSNLEFPTGVSTFKIKINDPSYNKIGSVNEVVSEEFIQDNNNYFRCIIPIQKSYNPPNYHIENEIFLIDEKVLAYGLINIIVEKTPYWIYSFSNNKEPILIIETKEETNFSSFYTAYQCIIYSLSLITGFLARDESLIILSSKQDFSIQDSFFFKRQPDSIDSSMEIISPSLVLQLKPSKTVNRFLPKSTFEALVKLLVSNDVYFRSVRILSQSNNLPKELRASSYCISLETVKNAILENNKNKVNPIIRPSTSKRLIRDFKKVLSNYSDDLFSSKEVIIKRLENINQQTNIDTFDYIFKIVNLKTNRYDKECLKLRDQFLHGKIPFYEDSSSELEFVILRLHFLVCALILKSCGFSGYLKNNLTYYKGILKHVNINEPLFRKI